MLVSHANPKDAPIVYCLVSGWIIRVQLSPQYCHVTHTHTLLYSTFHPLNNQPLHVAV